MPQNVETTTWSDKTVKQNKKKQNFKVKIANRIEM